MSLSGSWPSMSRRGLNLAAFWTFKLNIGGRMIGGGIERGRFAAASYFYGQVFLSAFDGGNQTSKMDQNSLTYNLRDSSGNRCTRNNEQGNG